jgi:hypothetical protein
MAVQSGLKIETVLPLVNWEGAKYRGGIKYGKTVLYYQWFKKVLHPFRFEKYGGKEQALAAAREFQIDYCWKNGGTFNEYGFADVNGQRVGVLRLSFGQVMFFSPQHLPLVTTHIWYAKKSGRTWYAENAKGKFHRFVLPGVAEIDHVDRNGLNNRLENLRPTTHAENSLNARRRVDNKTGFKGVYPTKHNRYWAARWRVAGKVYQRYFSMSTYGTQGAYERAVACRQEANEKYGIFSGEEDE